MVLRIAIDPGPHIGVALQIDDEIHTMTLLEPTELWNLIRDSRPTAVAFETFFTGNRVDVNMIHTIELVGSIRGICHALNIPAYGQQPQARKSFLEEAKILLGAGHSTIPHERDALAHLLLLIWREKNGRLGTGRTGRRIQEREAVPT